MPEELVEVPIWVRPDWLVRINRLLGLVVNPKLEPRTSAVAKLEPREKPLAVRVSVLAPELPLLIVTMPVPVPKVRVPMDSEELVAAVVVPFMRSSPPVPRVTAVVLPTRFTAPSATPT